MDPNTNLQDQRDIQALIANGEAESHHYDRLAELAEALDSWLTNGGFLPSAWAKGRGAV